MSQSSVTLNIRDANGDPYTELDRQALSYAAAQQFDTDEYRVVTTRKNLALITDSVEMFERGEVFHFNLPDNKSGFYLVPDVASQNFTDLVRVPSQPADPIPTGQEIVDQVTEALAPGLVVSTIEGGAVDPYLSAKQLLAGAVNTVVTYSGDLPSTVTTTTALGALVQTYHYDGTGNPTTCDWNMPGALHDLVETFTYSGGNPTGSTFAEA